MRGETGESWAAGECGAAGESSAPVRAVQPERAGHGARCHERGDESCHNPDMNLQMCTPLGNLSESERRSEICQIRSEAVV